MKIYFLRSAFLRISLRRSVSCAPKKQSKLRDSGPTKNRAPTKRAITNPRFFFAAIHLAPIRSITGVNIATMLFAATPRTPSFDVKDTKMYTV